MYCHQLCTQPTWKLSLEWPHQWQGPYLAVSPYECQVRTSWCSRLASLWFGQLCRRFSIVESVQSYWSRLLCKITRSLDRGRKRMCQHHHFTWTTKVYSSHNAQRCQHDWSWLYCLRALVNSPRPAHRSASAHLRDTRKAGSQPPRWQAHCRQLVAAGMWSWQWAVFHYL